MSKREVLKFPPPVERGEGWIERHPVYAIVDFDLILTERTMTDAGLAMLRNACREFMPTARHPRGGGARAIYSGVSGNYKFNVQHADAFVRLLMDVLAHHTEPR